jgi:ABC-type phosphate transport system permease subunit
MDEFEGEVEAVDRNERRMNSRIRMQMGTVIAVLVAALVAVPVAVHQQVVLGGGW